MDNSGKTHRDLEVYKRGIEFVTNIYQVTKSFPKDEMYGLTSQVRRASVSIPSNISEGSARNSNKEFIQFLHISLGSAVEVETHLQISLNLKYINQKQFDELYLNLMSIIKMLSGLIKYLKNKGK